nr:hypothetical protein [uncultured Roseateles sp.]
MLEAKISATSFLVSGVARDPCGPESIVLIEVSFSSLRAQILGWVRIHLLEKGSRNSLRTWCFLIFLMFGVALAFLSISAAQINQITIFAETPTAENVPERQLAQITRPIEKVQIKRIDTKNPVDWVTELIARPGFLLRNASITFAVPLLFLAALWIALFRKTICKIYLIVIDPHQPFPVIERHIAGSPTAHVIAIRALSRDMKEKFPVAGSNGEGEIRHITTLQLTHTHCQSIPKPRKSDELASYWALIRYAISLMLPPVAGGYAKAAYFTYKLHERLFFVYLLLIGSAVLIPSIGWVSKAEESQFPLIMAGLGLAWVLACIYMHNGKTGHLSEWERLTSGFRFRGCPLYKYTEPVGMSGRWKLIEPTEFSTAIREFGLDYSTFQQTLLSVMLVIYFTILQIIK